MAEDAPELPFVLFYQPPVTLPVPLEGGWMVAQLDALGVVTPLDTVIYQSYASAQGRLMREVLHLETAPEEPSAPQGMAGPQGGEEPPPEPPPEPPA